MNDVFNLPQRITTVGNNFAYAMFYYCSGSSFCMNDVFNLPQGITTVGNNFAYAMFYYCSGSSFCMNDVFNLPQGITAVGNSFADDMFGNCGGSSFCMNDVFNLPQGITTAGQNFAFGMFDRCRGSSFCMNDVFNLPQGITTVGDNFAYDMFRNCDGSSFCMNDVFNLPQGITTVGAYFAQYMFSSCSSSGFVVNDKFTFPILTPEQLNQGNMFYRTFYNLGVGSVQGRTATSIINGNNVPNNNMQTFLGSDCFVDRKYIAVNWGGEGLTYTVIYLSGDHGTWADDENIYSSVPHDTLSPEFGTQTGADVTVDHDLGYTFSGWKNKDTNTIYDVDDPLPKVTSDVTYVAQWVFVDYFVTWDLGAIDASIFGDVTGKVSHWDDDNLLPNGDPVRPAYDFVGWQLVHNGHNDVVGKFPVEASDKFSDFAYDDTVEGIVLVARWSFVADPFEDEFVVTYRGNGASGGSVPVDSSWYVYGERVVVLGQGSLVRNGYSFLGWSMSANAVVAQYTAGSVFYIYDDVTLYAVWSQNEYTVTFTSGAHGTFTTQVTSGLHYGDTTPTTPTITGETGWTFNGWSPTLSTTVTNDATYVAQWAQITTSPSPSASASPSPSPSASTPVLSASPSATSPDDPDVVGVGGSEWSIVNLLISVLGVVLAVLAAVFVLLGGRYGSQMFERRGLLWFGVVVVLAVVGVVVFLLTEDLGLPFGWVINKWTAVNAVLLVVESIAVWLCLKTVKSSSGK